VTRAEERYRPAYGRKEVVENRQCLFIGTTNRDAYLSDETGARRFWPIRISEVNLPGLQRVRDQLFAEAVAAYRRGEQWWPDRIFESTHIKPEQEARYEADPWEEAIAEYIEPLSRVTIADIARIALCIETVGKIGRADQNRIIGVLTSKGWRSGRDWRGRFYVAPGSAT
jgi:predicted P-loop ATPase